MVYIGAFCILIVLSLFFKLYIKFKMEEALFASMGMIIAVLTVFGIFGVMHIGQYFLYLLAFTSLLFTISYLIKVKWKIDVAEIITPGFVIISLSFIMYMIMTKGNILYIWDEASLYGTAAHSMDVTNTISNGGSVTVFTYFFTELIGYSEHTLLVSRWLFIWICVALPLSNVKWKKWYMAAIYAVFAFGIITLIDPETKYLMDAPIGIIAGSSIAYLAVLKNNSRNTILTLTCVLTYTLKDNIGLILLAFILMFYVVYYCIELYKNQWKLSKKNIINTSIFIVSISATILVRQIFMRFELIKDIDQIKPYLPIIITIVLGVIGFIVSWFLWLHKIFKKHITDKVNLSPQLKKILKIAALTITPMAFFTVAYKGVWRILYSLSMELQQDFIYALNQYYGRKYFGFTLWQLALMLLIMTVFCTLTIIRKERRSSFVAQSLSIVVMIIIYGFVISLLFIKQYHYFLVNHDMMGLERYMGSLLIMISVWLMSIVFTTNNTFIDDKKQIIAAMAVSLLLVRMMPLPGETMFSLISNSNMIANKYKVRPEIAEHTKIVNENTPEDATILIIAIDDENATINHRAWRYWMFYETAPRALPGIITSIKNKDDDGLISQEDLIKQIGHYDYVYIGNANDEFYTNYGDLFDTNEIFKTKALFKNNPGEMPQLTLVSHVTD
ncbi:MAG: hypothetical protein KAQ68_03530 [Clostridiales bacterium]|nr:hypothetical protein [Clostridiales bacterium]